MADRMCRTCRWHDVKGFAQFYGKAITGHPDLGFCRRNPPSPDFTRLLHPDLREEPRYQVMVFAFWPETLGTDWCGEWEAQEEQRPTLVGGGTRVHAVPEVHQHAQPHDH